MKTNHKITPHPYFLETLFAYKGQADSVFKDVLGLHDISHIALSYINTEHQLLTLSSTPSLEFNLFNSALWQFDKTYQSHWYSLCTTAPWQDLYDRGRYHELYYLKQIKHHYPVGLSMAIESQNGYVIYSVASHHKNPNTCERFKYQLEDFYRIGAYCNNALLPLFSRATISPCESRRCG